MTELRVQSRRPCLKPFQKGIKLICESTKGLFSDLSQAPVNLKYLLTSHLNQDHLESTFSIIRGIGGFNDHPLPADAVQRLKRVIISSNLRHPRTGNIHEENGVEFLSAGRLQLLVEGTKMTQEILPSDHNSDYFEEKFRFIQPHESYAVPSWATEQVSEKAIIGASEFLAGYIAKRLLSEYPHLKSTQAGNWGAWIGTLSTKALITPAHWWLCVFMKFEEYFEEYHKTQVGWNLNKNGRVITPLCEYLHQIYPNVPKKAIQFYLRVRTKIRVQAIKKKIQIVQRKRKVRQFLNFVTVDLEDEEEEDNDLVMEDFVIDEIAAAGENSETTPDTDDDELLTV